MTQKEYIERFNQILEEYKVEARLEGHEPTDQEMVLVEKAAMNICKSARQAFERGDHLKIKT